MNIKTIIGFGFRIISRIMEISEISAKSASADNTLLDLHNSLDDAQPHPIIVKSYRNCGQAGLVKFLIKVYEVNTRQREPERCLTFILKIRVI